LRREKNRTERKNGSIHFVSTENEVVINGCLGAAGLDGWKVSIQWMSGDEPRAECNLLFVFFRWRVIICQQSSPISTRDGQSYFYVQACKKKFGEEDELAPFVKHTTSTPSYMHIHTDAFVCMYKCTALKKSQHLGYSRVRTRIF
jgi:hypothetical protein